MKIFIFGLTVSAIYVFSVFILSNVKYKNTPFIVFTSNYYPSKGGHSYQSFNDFLNDDDFDAVFLGSSHAYRGFDPRIFERYGIKTFNLGTSGQNLESSEILYKKLILSKKVKAIVLEIHPRQFESKAVINESSFDIALNSPFNAICLNYIAKEHDWRFVNLLLYKNFMLSTAPVFKDSSYVGKGYSEKKDSANSTTFTYSKTFEPVTEKLNTLERIIQLAEKSGQRLVLVSHPMPHEFPKSVNEEFKQYIAPLLAKYRLKYFDYTANHNLNSDYHFYDYNHMNQAGVRIFDSTLIQNKDFISLIYGKRN